jgi:hypothetical protein
LGKLIEKTRSYAPELTREWENLARAYQLRYLARRAVSLQAGYVAVELVNQALASDWRILLEEPRRTLITLAAAYLVCLLPQPLYSKIENLALRITGATQRRRILQH